MGVQGPKFRHETKHQDRKDGYSDAFVVMFIQATNREDMQHGHVFYSQACCCGATFKSWTQPRDVDDLT